MATFTERIKRAWNVFTEQDAYNFDKDYSNGISSYYRPDRPRFTRGNERSIINAIYTRIAMDISQFDFKHIVIDEEGQYIGDKNSGLNYCLTTEANIDQASDAFKRDIVLTLFDSGVAAIVPIDTKGDPLFTDSYDIITMRVGRIVEWKPSTIKVNIYNDKIGEKVDVIVPKRMAAIIENPFYSVMNEPNSTLQRLVKKLNLLDYIDEQSGSGKLDLIIQLPYVIKTDARREQAKQRKEEIEMQLAGSKYGIAYTDGTEHITQLNRPVENNLLAQIKELTDELYSQLGITKEIMNGTANEQTLVTYRKSTLIPIISAISLEFKRKFISKTARTQGQTIKAYEDPLKFIPASQLAELADKFTRNEIMSPNELRQIIGLKPSDDPQANELRNRNISQAKGQVNAATPGHNSQRLISNNINSEEQQ